MLRWNADEEVVLRRRSCGVWQDFYLGDSIFVGQPGAPLRLRFRLLGVQSQPAPPLGDIPQNLYTWRLEIHNLDSTTYETVPVALVLITALTTPTGEQTGAWLTSLAAMNAAGFTDENYDALLLGTTRIYRLAAFAPAGTSTGWPTCWIAGATVSPGSTRPTRPAPATSQISRKLKVEMLLREMSLRFLLGTRHFQLLQCLAYKRKGLV
ncbi:MAG: hypothetical protein H6671_18080, partial [Anaerolineaceae bacterium]|nr:hypothetical protein [Anaerolineaceae bacterium]